MKPTASKVGPPKAATRAFLFAVSLALFNFLPSLQSASVKVSGFGLFGNAELRGALKLLEFEEGPLDSRKIDDGAFLLMTRLTQNGFLDARIEADYETDDGKTGTVSWNPPFEPQLTEEVSASKIRFKVHPGILYYYNDVSISGLQSIDPEEARSYIIPDSSLISRKKDRAYSESTLSNHQKQLAAALAALGRIDAKVSANSVDIDEKSGGVDIALQVQEGPLYKIGLAEAHYVKGEDTEVIQIEAGDTIYTRRWVEDQSRSLRNESYHLGFPDTKVSSRIVKATPEGDTIAVQIRFDIKRGPKIILSQVEHVGATDTHHPLLNRKTDLTLGVPLDITETEAARRRLSRIGIFERIDLKYEDDGTGKRKAVYEYTNSDRFEAQLLFGYGSYEQFRGGILARRENLFGRAHTLSFEAIRSIKSMSGALDYTIPELLGETIDGTLEVNFLDREELFFDRAEQGVSVGLFKRLPELKMDIGVDYAFDRKESSDIERAEELDFEETNIGSVSLRSTRSTLNNILYPTNGYELSGAIRYAAEALGGETEFIRPEFSGAYHTKLGNRWIFHLGAKAGMIKGPGDSSTETPYAERFLIGGENSIRGYRRGEAGPYDIDGKPINAEAFALLNLELEYPIFDQLNVVLFADTTRIWAASDDLGVYEDLSSVGLGLRYNTIVGPVRLEYGHNLNPRVNDPNGTLHLSIGFPF